MGRGGRGNRGGGRGRGRGGGGGGGRGNWDNSEDNRVSFEKVEKYNEKLERFYNDVLGLDEEEKDEFWATLRRELPNSFRFAGSKGHALSVQRLLKERYVPEISKITHYDGTAVEPPKPVPWYPDELAWWMTTPKKVIRRFPPFAAFQKYLVSETSVGNISRQEVVSMIPPLVMDLRPGMTVLDMCAAPGSKATQLLEMVHRGEEARVRKSLQDHAEEDGRTMSPGIERDVKIDMDNAEELDSDSSDYGRATVTNHDATMYPSIKLPPTPENPATNRYLKFDRILADVPCSGDGTTRKNVNLWQDWTPGNALGLYVTQVRILVRALQMLKVGGRVVYSTCSMNPVENEAIIASAIERCGGLEKVQLLPSDDQLPLLKRRPGLKTWKIMDKSGRVWNDWAEVQSYLADEENERTPTIEKLAEGMFTPPAGTPNSDIPFERCMRVYAHLQDTGGFFIAILEKQREFKAKPESEAKIANPIPPITSIINEIESKSEPKDGEGFLPKIEAADLLTQPTDTTNGAEVIPAAYQNLGHPPPNDSRGTKRSAENAADVVTDAVVGTKKLKTKGEVDTLDSGLKDRSIHGQAPPGAVLDISTRPGDMRPGRNRNGQQFEEPYKYISHEHPQVQVVEDFYQLSPRFPRDRFLVRNAQGDPAKTIYYTCALIRDILKENEGKGIKFIHAGVKMFMKQDVQAEGVCKWRIQSEGMPILEGYVGEERVVRLYKRETLRRLLVEMFPKVTDGGWKNLGEIGERVNNISMGCCVLRVEPSDAEDGFTERMVMPLWRSVHSLNLMLAKEDRTAMLLRIFNDTTALINNHNPSKKEERMADPADPLLPDVASGFTREDGTIKVETTSNAIECAAPVESHDMDLDIRPGLYGEIVAAKDTVAYKGVDVRAEQISKGEETGGSETQLNGMGGVEGQLGGVS
ncbi:hypothetical protein B7494_g137 [Chlorociboria aeruginascens]|nr:hypothetical protein B7494_g137 [Chlorociboria aeruginascens]